MVKIVVVLYIFVKEEKLVLDFFEQIKNGVDFGKLVKKYFICLLGKCGGDLGEFCQGQMVLVFDKVVFFCLVLELIGLLYIQFGYYIIKVLYCN